MLLKIFAATGIVVIFAQLVLLTKKTNTIMSTQKEAAAELVAFKEQLAKANDEIQAKIQALTDAANSADTVDPELQAAIDDLKPAVEALDNIVPDVVTDGGGENTDEPQA